MPKPARFLDLYDYRRRVFAMYRDRNEAMVSDENPEDVLARFQSARDLLFAEHPQSALDAGQKASFSGLRYFPYNPHARIAAEMVPVPDGCRKVIHLMDDEIVPLEEAAKVRFTFGGGPAELTVYWIDLYGGGLFLPFRDATASDETYGGGRYLFDTVKGSDFEELAPVDGKRRVVLDFNYAYNPSCAYNYRWVCPLAPAENHLRFRIVAGELAHV